MPMSHLPFTFRSTPWAVFTLAFSPEGDCLVLGGGGHYGAGGVALYSLSDCTLQLRDMLQLNSRNKPNRNSAVGLFFACNGNNLLVSSRVMSASVGHNFIFPISRSNSASTLQEPHSLGSLNLPMGRGLPLGFLQAEVQTEKCVLVCSPGEPMPLPVLNIPAEFDFFDLVLDNSAIAHRSLSSQGVIECGGDYIFPAHEHRQPGLSIQSNTGSSATPQFKATPDTILSLVKHPHKNSFVSGSRSGMLMRWRKEQVWCNEVLVKNKNGADKNPNIQWYEFNRHSVVGLGYLPNSNYWLSVTADVTLTLWHHDCVIQSEQIACAGSARALAVHPSLPLVAIGLKGTPEIEGRGFLLVDIVDWLSSVVS